MWRSNCAVLLALAACVLAPVAHAQDDKRREACVSLKTLSTASFKVETAEWVTAPTGAQTPAGTANPGNPQGAPLDAPAHCLFRVTLDPRPSGIPEMSYGIGIEIRLPANWNGRLLFGAAHRVPTKRLARARRCQFNGQSARSSSFSRPNGCRQGSRSERRR